MESDSGCSRDGARVSSEDPEDPESDLDYVHQTEGGANILCVGKDGIEKIVCTPDNDEKDVETGLESDKGISSPQS